jgi:CBS domain-containing protein
MATQVMTPYSATGHNRVREVMAKTICTAKKSDNVERVGRMMKDDNCGFVPVTEDGRVIGVITDRDIVMRCVSAGHTDTMRTSAGEVMSTHVISIDVNDTLDRAGELMAGHQVRRLPVVENGQLVGVLSHGNLVQALHGGGAALWATVGVTQGA